MLAITKAAFDRLPEVRQMRVLDRAAEIMATVPERTMLACVDLAVREELLLHGDPDAGKADA